jgi:4-amino-4-deoxy-L-arabinose transferase-like glycosyltransferase
MTEPQNTFRDKPITILALFIIGLILRLAWTIYARPMPVMDFEHYRILAEALLEHHQFGYPQATAYRVPLYPAFLAIMMIISKNTLWLSLCNAFLSSLLVPLVYMFALRLTDGNKAVSTCSGLLCALNPSFIFYSPVLASEHLFSLLMISGILLLYRNNNRLFYRIIMAGLVLGLAILARGEGIFYIPVFLMIVHMKARGKHLSIAWQILLLLACSLIVLPWYLRNLNSFGPGIGLSTSAGINFYFAHNSEFYGWHEPQETKLKGLTEFQANKAGFGFGIKYIRSNPGKAAVKVLKGTIILYAPSNHALIYNALRQKGWINIVERIPLAGEKLFSFLTTVFYIYILVLASLATLFYKKIHPHSRAVLLAIIFMNWFCYALVFFSHPRYRYIPEIMLCILAAFVIVNILETARKDQKPTAPLPGALSIFI